MMTIDYQDQDVRLIDDPDAARIPEETADSYYGSYGWSADCSSRTELQILSYWEVTRLSEDSLRRLLKLRGCPVDYRDAVYDRCVQVADAAKTIETIAAEVIDAALAGDSDAADDAVERLIFAESDHGDDPWAQALLAWCYESVDE